MEANIKPEKNDGLARNAASLARHLSFDVPSAHGPPPRTLDASRRSTGGSGAPKQNSASARTKKLSKPSDQRTHIHLGVSSSIRQIRDDTINAARAEDVAR
eukprot:scaffold206333_cov30-Tisochrysis_lutea.AAC.1